MNSHIVWLNEQEKIASFHNEDGYQEQEFTCREFFIAFLHTLQEQGYRFQ